MEEELCFKNWLLTLEMGTPITGAGAMGKTIEQDLEQAAATAQPGQAQQAMTNALEKRQQSAQGQQTSVADIVKLNQARDVIAQGGNPGALKAAMNKKMKKKMEK